MLLTEGRGRNEGVFRLSGSLWLSVSGRFICQLSILILPSTLKSDFILVLVIR